MNCRAPLFLATVVGLLLLINVARVVKRDYDASNSDSIELLRDMSFGSIPSPGSTPGSITSPLSNAEQGGRDLVYGDGDFTYADEGETPKLRVPHGSTGGGTEPDKSFTAKDSARAQTNYGEMAEIRERNPISRLNKGKDKLKLHSKLINCSPSQESEADGLPGTLVATLRYGVVQHFEAYFVDVYIGTPPQHFPLLLDTGSDFTWIRCATCPDSSDKDELYYDPEDSTSFREISCHDPRCRQVQDLDPLRRCVSENQTCPYIYGYGDGSNTTGNFALETFTVNLTARAGDSEFTRKDVMFGCGCWNGGVSAGASGMLGLGRDPLSLTSQFQSPNGQSFSYCLASRHSNPNASSRLVFGEDDKLSSRPGWNFTSFPGAHEIADSTFYYVKIKSIMVGGETLDIPQEAWEVLPDGRGGTIIDSGTPLSYFVGPAYKAIREAFERKVKAYPLVEDEELHPFYPCYNVSRAPKLEMPGFRIEFADRATWNFPVENSFIQLPDGIACLAMMEQVNSPGYSIIGNYLQQDFHMWFDMKKSRLGFAPRSGADVADV
ncbi:hypothetical protein BT93_A1735 [Corymbia citriodora subsp. variegata]|nr:hypothetical protein BT93_A1735 [Corymbia citriodora subsp. variegata]